MDAFAGKLFNIGEMILNAVLSTDGLDLEERQMVELLECRYGAGMVYLPRTRPRQLLSVAANGGFINSEGYLTRKGRIILARYFYNLSRFYSV